MEVVVGKTRRPSRTREDSKRPRDTEGEHYGTEKEGYRIEASAKERKGWEKEMEFHGVWFDAGGERCAAGSRGGGSALWKTGVQERELGGKVCGSQ